MRARAALVMVFLVTASLAADPAAGSDGHGAPTCAGEAATIWGGPGDDTLTGTSGGDVIAGLGGDDVITGGGGSDVICGGAGRDRLDGGPGRDLLVGGPGDDTLIGGPGIDTVSFQASPAPISASVRAGTATGEGNDLLDRVEGLTGSEYGDTLQATILWGGDGDDTLLGTARHDFLKGGPGDDVLRGLGGDDLLIDGPGRDRLRGGGGDDDLWGHSGDDWLSGGSGDDWIKGANGNDVLLGGPGAGLDELYGGPGRDSLGGGQGDDLLAGGDGNDELAGASGNDDLDGGRGDDVIRGGLGDDLLDTARRNGPVDQEGVDLLSGDAGWDICWMEGLESCEAIPGPACLGCGEGSQTIYPTRGGAITLYVAPDPLGTSSAQWFDFAGDPLVPNPGSCPAETTAFPDQNTTLHFFYVACAARPAGAYRAACTGTAECDSAAIGGWFVLTPEGWRE